MGTVSLVAQRRLTGHWRALVVAGVLLGVGFGLCLASFAAAHRTESAYERVLAAAEAPDAAIALRGPAHESEQSLRAIEGITDQRVYAGFIGAADGVDRILSAALLAPTGDRFPLELPTLLAGRLPHADAADEVFVNTSAAERGGLEIGQVLHFRLTTPQGVGAAEADVRIVGIGTLPVEAVADETMVLGVVVFTRAFYEAHQEFAVYAASNVDVAPGVDPGRDLAAAAGALGHDLQAVRDNERQAVNEALRPVIIILVAIGVLAFAATAVAASQVADRNRARWHEDHARLRTIGMTHGQIRALELTTAGVIAAVALATAALAAVLVSPVAPLGPLHDLDPAQGFSFDGGILGVGAVAVVVTIAVLTLAFSSARRTVPAPASRSPWLPTVARGATAFAGLTLGLGAGDGRRRPWRGVLATVAAATVMGLCAAFVGSAIALTRTSASYGFDADLLALNAYGDQSLSQLEQAFGQRDDVVAATAFTAGSFIINGQAVPGLAATSVKGELSPTLLRGWPPRAEDEIVIGRDTLDSIAADLNNIVQVRRFNATGGKDERDAQTEDLRVVGVATFPPVNQRGTDMPRLGIGALVTRAAFLNLQGEEGNDPEFTTVRLAEGADPAAVMAANSDGFRDANQSTTTWFTDAKPAELRQLDAAMPYLRGAPVVGYAILLAVIVQALWSRARANRHHLAVLRAVGSTRGQLDAVTAWQVAPFALAAAVLGLPLGIVVGRRAYSLFARSLAVVDNASTSPVIVAALVAALLLAVAIAGAVAVAVARRSHTISLLRDH